MIDNADKIAERVYQALYNLRVPEDGGFEWQHDPKEFLPANVCCDYVGKQRLLRVIKNAIRGE